MKYKKGEIKFFIDNGFIKKGEIIGMTTYKKAISNKDIVDVNLYFIQTGDFIPRISSINIIFQREEGKMYDTKVECFKFLDKTNQK